MGLRIGRRLPARPPRLDRGLRIGAGFRLGRHVWIGASVPLGHHARRLAAHRGHGDWFDTLVGLAIMWVFLRVCWALAWG